MPRYLMVCAGVLLLAAASGLDAITSRGVAYATSNPNAASELDALASASGAISSPNPIEATTRNASKSSGPSESRWNTRQVLFVLLTGGLLSLGLPASFRIQREIFNGPFQALAEHVNAIAKENATTAENATANATKTSTNISLKDSTNSEVPVLLHVDGQTVFPAWHAIANARHVLLLDKGATFDISEGGVYDTRRLAATEESQRGHEGDESPVVGGYDPDGLPPRIQ
ncbi:MAG: hypothetical protein QM784_22110 [Polyangiaceae bacterium]